MVVRSRKRRIIYVYKCEAESRQSASRPGFLPACLQTYWIPRLWVVLHIQWKTEQRGVYVVSSSASKEVSISIRRHNWKPQRSTRNGQLNIPIRITQRHHHSSIYVPTQHGCYSVCQGSICFSHQNHNHKERLGLCRRVARQRETKGPGDVERRLLACAEMAVGCGEESPARDSHRASITIQADVEVLRVVKEEQFGVSNR